MTSATKTGGVEGLEKFEGKVGKEESGTEVALLEGAAKHAVTKKNGRRDRTCMKSYTDGGVRVEVGCRSQGSCSFKSLYSRYSPSSAQLLDALSIVAGS